VISPWRTSHLSHNVVYKSLVTFDFTTAAGSENINNGSAKLRKAFLRDSSLTFPAATLINSILTSPDTAAVEVAIAGIMCPATRLAFNLSVSAML